MNGCWIWKGNISKETGGYGLFDRRRKNLRVAIRAHRLAYELVKGSIPEGLMLRHICDNPPCVNPEHLIPGTAQENSDDMVSRRRHWTQVKPQNIKRGVEHWTAIRGTDAFPRGELHHNSKLSEQEVLEIREKYSSRAKSQRALAKEYQVYQATIYQIVNNKYWRMNNVFYSRYVYGPRYWGLLPTKRLDGRRKS